MTTKGNSMGFQVSSVDYVFVVPAFELTSRGTMLVYQCQSLPNNLHSTTYLALIYYRFANAIIID